MNWYLQALKKYADFSGRARRKEYWFFILFYLIILIVLMIVDGFVGTQLGGAGFGILTCIYALAMLIPALAVTVRRLHDTGRSGWWILIQFVPLVGSIVWKCDGAACVSATAVTQSDGGFIERFRTDRPGREPCLQTPAPPGCTATTASRSST